MAAQVAPTVTMEAETELVDLDSTLPPESSAKRTERFTQAAAVVRAQTHTMALAVQAAAVTLDRLARITLAAAAVLMPQAALVL